MAYRKKSHNKAKMYRITLILSNRFIVLTVHVDFTGILNPNQIEKIRE
jgi:hypothetical protein